MAIERIVPATRAWNAFYANHICRYRFAVSQLAGRNVHQILDAACGVGYGSKYLSEQFTQARITAIDRSDDALKLAGNSFAAPSVIYQKDDCLTFEEAAKHGPYDAVVSFETLEHLPDPARFLKNCYTSLRSNGVLVISTPNQLVSSPGNQLNWEFHEKEYAPEEYLALLQQAGFNRVKLFGQQYNLKGKIKNEVRADLNRIWSNPFVRAGRWIQSVFKGHRFDYPLNESVDDFDIVHYEQVSTIESLGIEGPFVLIAVAEK